jgi:hypothetical protein
MMNDEQKKEYIRRHYPDQYTKDIASVIGWSTSKIYNYVNKIGLKKGEKWREMNYEFRKSILIKSGEKYRFKKGQEPVNKGVKMSDDIREKIKGTWFKKGQQPSNANYDGHERVDKEGYTMIRIAPGRYEKKHRVLWESVHGPIPQGCIIVFKDKNKKNIRIDNLEIITRLENMRRNTLHQYPEELKSMIKLVNKLKKKINEKQD